MGRNGKSIFKFSLTGRLQKKYSTVTQAVEAENITRYRLTIAIQDRKALNKSVFSFTPDPPKVKTRQEKIAEAVDKAARWCAPDGMFDVKGWLASCY